MNTIRRLMAAMLSVLVADVLAAITQITVPEGQTMTFSQALTYNGYETFPANTTLEKIGPGTLISASNISGLQGVRVSAGVQKFASNSDVGVVGYGLTVNAGGTAWFVQGMGMYNRNITIAGSGASGMGGALVGDASFSAGNFTVVLSDDATVMSRYADDYWPIFNGGSSVTLSGINLAGHVMTLRAAEGCPGLGVYSRMRMRASGTIVVDGTAFAECSPDRDITQSLEDTCRIVDPGAYVMLKLINGASFLPKSQALTKLFGGIDCEYGTTIASASTAKSFDVTIGDFAGVPTLGTGVTGLVVTNGFTVKVADLAQGHALEASVPITFAAGCALEIEGDIRNLNPGSDGKVTIVSSTAGITGCPVLAASTRTRHWTVEKSDDEQSICLVYDPLMPEGMIDVRTEWGVKAGPEGVEGNAERFNAALAALPQGSKPQLYFPGGDYYFDAPLVIARDDVTVLGDAGESVLRAADDAMTTVLSVTGASRVGIGLMGFADCDGTAVSATSATDLKVTNNFYTAIGGEIANVSGTHPVSASGCGNTCVKFNRVTDGAVYTSLAYHDGGTKTADSDPYTRRRIWVDAGATEDFVPAFAAMGLGTDYTPAAAMEKWGLGTLVATNIFGGGGGKMAGLEIHQGTYHARQTWDEGAHANGITVKAGATLEHEFANSPYARAFFFVGDGAPDKSGAVVCLGSPSFIQMSLHVTENATVATKYAGGYAHFLGRGYNPNMSGNLLYLEGHDLRFIAAEGCPGFSYGDELTLKDSGTITVDGTVLAEDNKLNGDSKVKFAKEAGATVVLKLVNGAQYLPTQQAFVSLLAGIDTEWGTTVNGRGASVFDMSIARFAGAATVGDKVSSLTVSDRLTLRIPELAAGHALTAAGALVFGVQSVLELEGDISDLVPDEDGKVVLATSAVSVTGCPTLVRTTANRHWSVAVGADGKSLVLVYDSLKPEGAIDVRADWGVLTGEDNVDGNAGRFNAALAACGTANPVLFFPDGDYYFDEPLSVGAKEGVTILSDNYSATLHGVGEGQKTILSVTGAQNLNVCFIRFAGCAGTAVSASGTTALAVSNCLYTAIGGTIDNVEGLYPVEVRSGADTMIHANRVTDGQTYAAAAYYDGGTKAEGCEPVAGEVHLWVDAGETEEFQATLAKAGYAEWPDQARVVKEGPGTLIGTGIYASQTVAPRIRGVTVRGGVMNFAGEADLGMKTWSRSDRLVVENGATAVLYGNSGWGIQNRGVHLAGSGFPGMGGALVLAGKASLSYIQFYLDDDAVVCTKVCEGSYTRSRLLCTSNNDVSPFIHFYGHKLTLKCADGVQGYLLEHRLMLSDTGTLEIDGTDLYESRATLGFTIPERGAGSVTTLKLVNGGTYTPKTQNTVSLFDNIETDEGTRVDALTENLAMTVAGWKGLGSVAGLASLTVTNAFTAEASELIAGKYPTLSCPIVFGANAKLRINDPDGLFAAQGTPARYTCAVSSDSITGHVRKDRTSDFTNWKAGTTSDTLYVDTYPGIVLIVR